MYKPTASPFPLLYIMQVLCATYHLYLCTLTHVYVLFAVWSSALVRTDWQTNALTPSICSTVTSLMLWMLLVLYTVTCSSVACVVCMHTVHRSVSGLPYAHLLIHVTLYVNVCNIKLYMFICQLLLLLLVPNVHTIIAL